MLPFLLAPMAELSHRALRALIEDFGGCDEYFTEMISAAALCGGGPFEQWYIDNGPCPEKLVYQLVGADSAVMAKAAALLDQRECKGIDLNMGCCAPLIRKTGAGIAWMSSIDRAGEGVKAVRKAVKRRLSVKLRIGPDDNFEYLVNFCRRLEAEGVDLLILHPRTAKEKFKRAARWGYVSALQQELHIPVAGNGDITDAEGLATRAHESGYHAVMVGRAAVRQPWMFAEARKAEARPAPKDFRCWARKAEVRKVPGTFCENGARHQFIEETGVRFLELLARWQPPEFHVSRARRFFGFYCDNLKWGTHVKNLLNREDSLSGMEKVWREHFVS